MYYVQLYIGNRKAFFEQIWLFIHVDIQIHNCILITNVLFFLLQMCHFPPPISWLLVRCSILAQTNLELMSSNSTLLLRVRYFFITFSMIRYFGPEIKSLLYIHLLRYIFTKLSGKLRRLTPSFGCIMAVRPKNFFFSGIKLFCFSRNFQVQFEI